MKIFFAIAGMLLVFSDCSLWAQLYPSEVIANQSFISQTLNQKEEFLRHRFGIAPSLTFGDKLSGNLMFSVIYAYRLSNVFEIEANVGMMSNPFLHRIIGLNSYNIEEFEKRKKGNVFFSFIQSGSVLADVGATITPFSAPWDCVHFTVGIAVQRWTGYMNIDYYRVLIPPVVATPVIDFQNFYFDIIRPLAFVRLSTTIPITERLNVDIRLGLYASDQDITGVPFGSNSGDVFIRLVNVGAVVSYRL
jgi:hypothetical protein